MQNLVNGKLKHYSLGAPEVVGPPPDRDDDDVMLRNCPPTMLYVLML